MRLYFFRIRNGRFSGVTDCGTELPDHDAAWQELTKVCGDLVGSISVISSKTTNGKWNC
jgi:hypothetical protein